jgi:hypothetical protein
MGTERTQHPHRRGAMKRIAVASTLVAFGVTGFVGAGAFAASNDEFVPGSTVGPGDHVPICHALGNGDYSSIAPSSGSVFGHAGAGHEDGRDVIPPFVFQPNGNKESNMSLAAGQNWDAAGQALWARGCVAGTTPTETTPTETTPTETTPTETTPTETTPTETTPTETTPTETTPTQTTPTETTPTQTTPAETTPTQTTSMQTTESTPTQPSQPAQPTQRSQPTQPTQPAPTQPTPPRKPTQSKPKPQAKPKPTRKAAASAARSRPASVPAELAYTP